jgi:hypothetical protein
MQALIRAAAVAAIVCGVAVPGTAQAQYLMKVQRNDVPREAADSSAHRAMRHDLLHLQLAQDAYFSMWGRYAAQLSDLADLHLESGATFTLSNATETTWEVVATHPRLTGEHRVQIKRDAAKRASPPAPPAPGL